MLTNNEKKVLSLLLDNARSSDSEIAVKVKLTPQGVRKIRLKLEKEYISEYRTIVDYSSIGITVFAIAQMRILKKDVLTDKHIIGAFDVSEAGVTHVLILGFSSVDELDTYKKDISGSAEIVSINVLSKNGFLRNSPLDLVKGML